MRVIRYATEGIETIEDPNWTALLAEQDAVIWVDLTTPGADDVKLLRDVFHFHPLAIEDTLNQRQRPKDRGIPRSPVPDFEPGGGFPRRPRLSAN